MSRARRYVLLAGLLLLGASATFPPWVAYRWDDFKGRQPLGRWPFWTRHPFRIYSYTCDGGLCTGPVYVPGMDLGRMFAEWVVIGSATAISMFIVPAIVALPGSIRGRSRRRRGLCVKCGYNLTGNTSGICPECGTDVRQESGGPGEIEF